MPRHWTYAFITTTQSTSGVTGGRPAMIGTIKKERTSGADGLFIETHFDPKTPKAMGQIY